MIIWGFLDCWPDKTFEDMALDFYGFLYNVLKSVFYQHCQLHSRSDVYSTEYIVLDHKVYCTVKSTLTTEANYMIDGEH